MEKEYNNPLKLKCPDCGSTKLMKSGRVWSKDKRTNRRRKFQRWVCDNCGLYTIKPRGWEKQYD